jgi:hypothetical protein
MAGRKNELSSYPIFSAQSAATNFDNFSKPTNVTWLDNAGITVQWTGSPVGTLEVYVSNDNAGPFPNYPVANWQKLDFGAPIVIDGTNTNLLINMNQLPFNWLAMKYVSTSGTGTLSAQLTSKEV